MSRSLIFLTDFYIYMIILNLNNGFSLCHPFPLPAILPSTYSSSSPPLVAFYTLRIYPILSTRYSQSTTLSSHSLWLSSYFYIEVLVLLHILPLKDVVSYRSTICGHTCLSTHYKLDISFFWPPPHKRTFLMSQQLVRRLSINQRESF